MACSKQFLLSRLYDLFEARPTVASHYLENKLGKRDIGFMLRACNVESKAAIPESVKLRSLVCGGRVKGISFETTHIFGLDRPLDGHVGHNKLAGLGPKVSSKSVPRVQSFAQSFVQVRGW